MPREKKVFTDHFTLEIPAFDLGNGFTCSGAGLHFKKIPRMSSSELLRLLQLAAGELKPEKTPDPLQPLLERRDFLYAQCQFLGLPANLNDTRQLTSATLLTALKDGRDIAPKLQSLELSANQQYRELVESIRLQILKARFVPDNPVESPMSYGLRPSKRKRVQNASEDLAGGDAVLHNHSGRALPTPPPVLFTSDSKNLAPAEATRAGQEVGPSLGGDELDEVDHTSDNELCSRGSTSAVFDTLKSRARRPDSKAQSFLLQLMLDGSEIERAISIVSSTQVKCPPVFPASPSGDYSESNNELRTECHRLTDSCIHSMGAADVTGFKAMVAHIELAMWILRTKCVRKFTIAEAHRLLGNPDITDSQFRHWNATGYVLLRLIRASSVYILASIAISTMRTVAGHLAEPELSEVENALRQPELMKGPMRHLVLSGIIHFVRELQARVTSGVVLGNHTFGLGFASDDKFLDYLFSHGKLELPPLPRSADWDSSFEHFVANRLVEGHTAVITCNFDRELEQNRLMPPELRKSPKNNYDYTVHQRALAAKAYSPTSLEEFSYKIREQLATGVKKPNSYLRLSSSLTSEKNVLIHGKGGKEEGFMCFVLSGNTLTEREKVDISQMAKHIAKLEDQVVDSQKEQKFHKFQGKHLGVWGKMSKSGKNADPDDIPREFIGTSSQPGPYPDRAVRSLADDFDETHFYQCPLRHFNSSIISILRPVLVKLRAHIPGLVDQHETLSDSLAPSFRLGSTPFCMTVLNVQGASRAHRDVSDEIGAICLILAVGDYDGGGLCLVEAGLRLDLAPGTFAVIRSKEDVHFNLDFKGQRLSFVFTSDQGLRRWQRDRNHLPFLQGGLS